MYDEIASVAKLIEKAPINPCWKCQEINKEGCTCVKLKEYKDILVELNENGVIDPETCITLHQISQDNISLQELPENVRIKVDIAYCNFYCDLILQEHKSSHQLEAFMRLLIDWSKGNKMLYTLYGLNCLDDVKCKHSEEPDIVQSLNNGRLQNIEKEIQKLETDMQQCLERQSALSDKLMKLF